MSTTIEYLLFRLIGHLAHLMPYGAARRIGNALGIGVLYLTGYRKRITLDNLTRAFPDASPAWVHHVMRGAYKNYGSAIVEMFWAGGRSAETLKAKVHLRNPEVLHNALQRNAGLILMSAQSNSLVLGSIAGVNSATASINVGIGTPAPARQLHLSGSNAVFRMDRSTDTAAFMLVRTDAGGTPQKTFVVGTNASGANTGEFVINDLGTAVAGPGTRRMTITNNGAVDFPGIVTAPQFIPMSSLAFKTNVQTYENALDTVNRLRGVRFDWKETGKPSVGLIAEEVDRVVPEVVAHNDGSAMGVNYSGLVGVLVEAVKEQQTAITKQQEDISQLKAEINRLKSKDMIAHR